MTAKRRSPQQLTPAERAAILARHGIVPGAEGYAWGDLTALCDQHGWHIHVEPARTPKFGHHVRALVWADAQLTPSGGTLARLNTRGRGATDEDALADALARLLKRMERGAGFGR